MAKMGQLGCTGPEARDRLKRLLKMGLQSIRKDNNIPLTLHEREFLRDMSQGISDNELWEPSFGQVTYAQDLYDKYCL